MHVMVETLRYATGSSPFIANLQPFAHQLRTLAYVRQAIKERRTICIENTSVTGSGKTLANFAAAILDGVPTCGIYPTNELMLDQLVSLKKYLHNEMMLLDSQGLDDILDAQPHMRSHAETLAWATGEDMRVAVLTNPDVLYLAMYDLYGQMFSTFHKSFGERVFQHMLGNYPAIAFDEFHLNKLLNEAYLGHEEFIGYTRQYSPLEAVAACERIQRQYFEDTKPQAEAKLHRLVPALYDKDLPPDQEEAEKCYQVYRKPQRAVWAKYGAEIRNPASKAKKYYLSDLESFRGGLESDFTVAIYDDLDEQLNFKPIKTYGLPFVLRRTNCEELSQHQFEMLVRSKHPKKAEEWLGSLQRHRNLLGYIHVHSLVGKQPNETYFEVPMRRIENVTEQQVIRIQGLTITAENAHLHSSAGCINARLEKKTLNCWVSERSGFKLSEALRLPPLFAIYPLHALRVNGTFYPWSIAFGLDAFLLASLPKRRLLAGIRSDNTAIII